jgi:pimeloyl-ACP methyl ester carboxylesterase
MKNIIAVFLVFILLFGCIQLPGAGSPKPTNTGGQGGTQSTVVNVTPTVPSDTKENATLPVVIVVNQTTQNTSGNQQQATGLTMPPSSEITYTTSDSWKIYGTHYPSKEPNPKIGIILLHELGSNRSSFDQLVPVLHDELPYADILAIDLRGHGLSTNIGKYPKFITGDYRAMKNDVDGAFKYLSFFRNINNRYYVVGSSIGSTAAIRYSAENAAVISVVMISPGMNYQNVDITQDLTMMRKRLLLVAAEGDSSGIDAQTAYTVSQAYDKELLIYKTIGAVHGTGMFNASEKSSEGKLTEKIASWLKQTPQ